MLNEFPKTDMIAGTIQTFPEYIQSAFRELQIILTDPDIPDFMINDWITFREAVMLNWFRAQSDDIKSYVNWFVKVSSSVELVFLN